MSKSLLLHLDGIDGSTLFYDSSGTSKTPTLNGTPMLSTSQKKFGATSLNSSTGVLIYSHATEFSCANSCSLDFWMYRNSATASRPVGQYNGSTGWFLQVFGDGGGFFSPTGSSAGQIYFPVGAFPVNTWTHIAISLSVASGLVTSRVFINGVLTSGSTTTTASSSTGPLVLGGWSNSYPTDSRLAGFIDEFRFVAGEVLFTTDFTPPLGPYEYSSLALTGPSQTLVFNATAIVEHATLDLTAPMTYLTFYGGINSTLTAPRPQLSFLAHQSYGENALFVTAPKPTLSFFGGSNSTLTAPRPTLSAAGTVTTLTKANLEAPSPSLTASGTVAATAQLSLTAPSPNLIGYGGAVCSITLTGRAKLLAAGTTGSIGGAQITCPLFELTATATAQNHGSALLTAPSPKLGTSMQAYLMAPMAKLTAIGSAVVTATYEAYAVNLKHGAQRPGQEQVDEVTHYTNFPFTHIVRYQNSYFGASATGLYLLEGTTDDGAPIAFNAKTHVTDFGKPEMKTLDSAYFGGRLGPAETITLYAGEKTTNAYPYTTPRGAKPQNYRQVFGKGLKARYYALGMSGDKDFELDTVDVEVATLKRRI